MKKKLIIILVSIIISITVIGGSIYAWYVNKHKVGKINAKTDGIVLTYQLNDGYYNVKEYDITNLAFFDIDNATEGKYFKNMAYEIQIKLKNTSVSAVDITISQTGLIEGLIYNDSVDYYIYENEAYSKVLFLNKSYDSLCVRTGSEGSYTYTNLTSESLYDSSAIYCKRDTKEVVRVLEQFIIDGSIYIKQEEEYIVLNSAYATCIISKNEIEQLDLDKSVEEYISENSFSNSITLENINISDGEQIIYMYVYGVQLNDLADNSFLQETYPFSFTITAVPKE